ncbi:uncharacterized protein LOC123382714 isoform X4 [Felis catus]|uniref:uncharacterized protein LOC123382714 isoform X4 n=1 Tax=Felis catus TaxID=9685 RepID=UPI001D1A0028|nr:uncharacterized protein LOC123382714 isoform X4 [Felis catus]XP_044904440.1 uncharacterized protein LOC123382714 isoform X4 [Felis catus]XP_044904441.1 uncharacterized protein LOC123382714 isoform X4 [Felis catus]
MPQWGMLLDLIDTGVGHVICFGQKFDKCVMKWSLPCVCTLDLCSELHSEKYICQVTMDLGRIRDMWNRQISTQVVAAMATAVIDICSSISALRQGRGTSPGNLAEVLGAAVIAHPWPTEAIMTVLCAFARARSMSTLGTGEEAPRMPVSRTLGHQWLLRHYILAHLTNENGMPLFLFAS